MVFRAALILWMMALATAAIAQVGLTPEVQAVRRASPGFVTDPETGDSSVFTLDLHRCVIIQTFTLLANDSHEGGTVFLATRLDLRDLDREDGFVLLGRGFANGDRYAVSPSRDAVQAGLTAEAALVDAIHRAQEDRDGADTAHLSLEDRLRLRVQENTQTPMRLWSAEVLSGQHGEIPSRTHHYQVSSWGSIQLRAVQTSVTISFQPDHAEAAIAAIEAVMAGECADG